MMRMASVHRRNQRSSLPWSWCLVLLWASAFSTLSADESKTVPLQEAEAILAGAATCELPALPLTDFIDRLSRRFHLPIAIDERALLAAGLRAQDLRLALSCHQEPLGAAISSVLRPAGLMWLIRHRTALITTPAAADEYVETRIYRLTKRVPVERRVRSITWTVAPDSWASAGGTGDAAPIPPDLIAVRQTASIQRRVGDAFAQSIALVTAQASDGEKSMNGPEHVHDIHLRNVPLVEALWTIGQQWNVTIRIDENAFAQAGLALTGPVITFDAARLRGVESALSLLLEQAGPELSWTADTEGIKVTTAAAARQSRTLVVYDISGLVWDQDIGLLLEAIRYTVAPADWEETGGDGTISAGSKGGELEVSQSEPVHRELRWFLNNLKAVRAAVPLP